jgi:flagellar hook assembly protein FlgD
MISPRDGGFAQEMAISFTLGSQSTVTVRVFDMAGHMIRTLVSGESRSPGSQVAQWDGRDDRGRVMYSGLYLVRVEAGGKASTKVVSVINGGR